MVEAIIQLYLISQLRIARLKKTLSFAALPRVGEYVKLQNRELGNYIPYSVIQVTHHEGALPELWLQSTTHLNGRSIIDFFQDSELEEYCASYVVEGWVQLSMAPNRMSNADGTSCWTEILSPPQNLG